MFLFFKKKKILKQKPLILRSQKQNQSFTSRFCQNKKLKKRRNVSKTQITFIRTLSISRNAPPRRNQDQEAAEEEVLEDHKNSRFSLLLSL